MKMLGYGSSQDYFGCRECSGYETKRECYNGR